MTSYTFHYKSYHTQILSYRRFRGHRLRQQRAARPQGDPSALGPTMGILDLYPSEIKNAHGRRGGEPDTDAALHSPYVGE